VQEAYARGVEDGRAEAAREAHEHLEARERVLNEAVEALRREAEQIAERAEAAVAPLAVGIAGHVLGAEVEAGFQLAEAMAHRSLARLGRAARVVLRVHPEDRSAVEQAIASKDAVAAEQSIEVVADDTVRRGGCLAETDVLSVDARLDSQLQAIAEELGSMNMSGVGDST
jgi:flagellar assembly protein FliH